MIYGVAMDPLLPLFGSESFELFQRARFVVVHGSTERLPAWMHSGLLESIESLCRDHRGHLEIAHGGQGTQASAHPESFIGAGGQSPVRGSPPQALLRLGLTVFFGGISTQLPAAKDFLRNLEGALGIPPCAGMSAFANAPGSGLPFHHDSFDQLLIQLQGTKRFVRALRQPKAHPRISVSPSGPTAPHFETVYRRGFVEDDQEIQREGIEEHVLKPGSCIFMPAGTWHRTADQKEACLSLVVAVRAPSKLDILTTALQYLAAQSEEYRAPAYGLFQAPRENRDLENTQGPSRQLEVENCLESLAHRLVQQAGVLKGADMRRAWQESLLRDGNPATYPLHAGFKTYIRLPGTSVRFEVRPAQGEEEEKIRLVVRCAHTIRDNLLEFSPPARVILDAILTEKGEFESDEMASRFEDFEEEEVEIFLEQLAQVGLLRPIAMPLFG